MNLNDNENKLNKFLKNIELIIILQNAWKLCQRPKLEWRRIKPSRGKFFLNRLKPPNQFIFYWTVYQSPLNEEIFLSIIMQLRIFFRYNCSQPIFSDLYSVGKLLFGACQFKAESCRHVNRLSRWITFSWNHRGCNQLQNTRSDKKTKNATTNGEFYWKLGRLTKWKNSIHSFKQFWVHYNPNNMLSQ